ncbi:hypothetical protein SESBI_14212 [Sesbania bispinosa]|nr:hypothetical protein SESBI_14212 [Sesbania bispinosa]
MLTKLPNKLQAATQQADQAKSLAQAANADLLQAQYEAKQARTTPITLENVSGGCLPVLAQAEKILVAPSLRALVFVPLLTIEREERNRYAVNNLLPSFVKMSLVVALPSLSESEIMVVAPLLCALVVVRFFTVEGEETIVRKPSTDT